MRWLQKATPKKLPATPNTALSFGGISRAVALALFGFVFTMGFNLFTTDGTLLCRPAVHQSHLLCILLYCLHIYARPGIEPFVNHIALTML